MKTQWPGNLMKQVRTAVSVALYCSSVAISAQVPFRTDFVQYIDAASEMHCALDLSGSVAVSMSDPGSGNEFQYNSDLAGTVNTITPGLVGSTVGANKINKLEFVNGSTISYGLNLITGQGGGTWSKLYLPADTIRYPDLPGAFSLPFDMHPTPDRVFACGQTADSAFVFASDHFGNLLWDTIIHSNNAFSSITAIGDTVYSFRRPWLYKFNAISGNLTGLTFIGGEGVGKCTSKGNSIYWASSFGAGLWWGKHIPDSGDVYWDSLTMTGVFTVKSVQVDHLNRMWIAGNDAGGGKLIVFSPDGTPTVHQFANFIGDMKIEDDRIVICGGNGSDSSSIPDLKFLLTGTIEE